MVERFIGRLCEHRRLVKYIRPSLESPKNVVLVYGPSGIGKTRLVLEALKTLRNEGYGAVYVALQSLGPVSRERVLEELLRGVVRSLGISGGLVKRVAAELGLGVLVERVLGTEQELSGIVSLFYKQGVEEYYRFLLRLAAKSSEKGAVIVIDEAQYLLGLEDEAIRGFIKLVADIQHGLALEGLGAKLVMVTSDYAFGLCAMRSPISPLYVVPFYLGEMTLRDSEALAKEYGIDMKLVDIIGGHPQLLLSTRAYGVDKICALYEQALLRLRDIARENPDTMALLYRVAQAPLGADEANNYRELVEKLVQENILQYGDPRYIGIYNWNKECNTGCHHGCGGGGIGIPSVIAPANRVTRAAILKLLHETYTAKPEETHRDEESKEKQGEPRQGLEEMYKQIVKPLETLCT